MERPRLYCSCLGGVEYGHYKRLDRFGEENLFLFYEVGQCFYYNGLCGLVHFIFSGQELIHNYL